MPSIMKELGIDKLDPAERVELALEIWESLDVAPGAPLSEEQLAEIHRRDADLAANPETALTWQQIRTSVEGRS